MEEAKQIAQELSQALKEFNPTDSTDNLVLQLAAELVGAVKALSI